MPLLEDQETKTDGSHDNLADMSASERAESDQLLAAAADDDGLYKEDGKDDKEKKGAASTAGAALAASSPIGRFLKFFSRNKKQAITGTGILGGLISIAIFIASIVAPTQLIWMNSIFQDFNFGPHNRSVTHRAERIRILISDLRVNDTRMGAQADAISSEPSRMQRTNATDSRLYSRANQRFNYRSTVTNRINTVRGKYNLPSYRWSVFTGDPSTSSNFRSFRNLIRGTDSTRARTSDVGPQRYQEAADDIRTSDNPTRATRSWARSFARGSLTGAALAAACISSVVADVIPDLEQRYEILLSRQGHFLTAGSQLASGEDVHGDEISEATEAFQDTVPALTAEEQLEVGTGGVTTVTDDEGNTSLDVRGSDLDTGLEQMEDDELTRSFEQSAAWKRATNLEISGDEPDVEFSFPGQESMAGQGVLALGRAVNNFPGAKPACSALSTPWVGWTLTVVEGVASLFSGPGAVVRFGLVEGAVATLAYLIMNMAFDALVPENPAELMGQIDMGMNLSQSEHARSQGAPPATNEEIASLRQEHFALLAQEDRERGFAWRYLSTENPRSIATSIVMTHNLEAGSIVTSIAKIPSNIFSLVTSNLIPSVSANSEFTNYEIEQYAFSTEVLDSINPVSNDVEMTAIEGYRCFGGEDGGLVDGAGTECDESRWNSAVLMSLIVDRCMNEPYYRQMGYDNADDHPEYVREWTWQRTEGPNDEISHQIDCTEPSDTQRRFWERLGAWILDRDIMDNIECLSHNDPC